MNAELRSSLLPNFQGQMIGFDLDNSIILDRGGSAGLVEAALRTRFADTAFWTPSAVTDGDGNATIEFDWPDNLTEWKAACVGVTAQAQVGAAHPESDRY